MEQIALVCRHCGSEESSRDKISESEFCSKCGVVLRHLATECNSIQEGCYSEDQATTPYNSMANEYLPHTSSKIKVKNNFNLTRTCMYESSNNHEIALMGMWKLIKEKLRGTFPDYATKRVETLYAEYCKDNSNRDKVKWGIVAGIAYYVGIVNDINILKSRIIKIFNIDNKNFSNGLVCAQKFLARIDKEEYRKYSRAQIVPISMINTYGKNLGCNEKIIEMACNVASQASKIKVLAPATMEILSAACLYGASQQSPENNIPLKVIVEMFDVSENGVNKYAEYIKHNPQLFVKKD